MRTRACSAQVVSWEQLDRHNQQGRSSSSDPLLGLVDLESLFVHQNLVWHQFHNASFFFSYLSSLLKILLKQICGYEKALRFHKFCGGPPTLQIGKTRQRATLRTSDVVGKWKPTRHLVCCSIPSSGLTQGMCFTHKLALGAHLHLNKRLVNASRRTLSMPSLAQDSCQGVSKSIALGNSPRREASMPSH